MAADVANLDGARISAAELAAVAKSLEPWCTTSTPRWLRRRRLLPEPTRIGGSYFYPSYAADLLRADTRWRARGVRDVEARRFLLWVEGFPIPLSDIRSLLEQVVGDWVAGGQELLGTMATSLALIADSDGALSPDVIAGIKAMATEIASMRSRSPLPAAMRKRRMPKREKEEAITFALLSLLNLSCAAAEHTGSAAAVDRMMGLDRRRKNMKPVLLAEDPLAVLRFAETDRLKAGARADDDEIEVARRYMQLGFALSAAFVAVMALDLGPSIEQAWLMLQETPVRLIGPLSALGVASIAGAIHAHRDEIDIEWVLEKVELAAVVFELHESFEKASERFAFRQALSPSERDQLNERLRQNARSLPMHQERVAKHG